MYDFIYNFLILPILKLLSLLLRAINPKVKERYLGLEKSHLSLKILFDKYPTVWFHSASMGEFEQAKPIIEKIKANSPTTQIVCSFYSPSGYNTQKDYKLADCIVYLPDDTPFAAKRFIDEFKPQFAVFVRYEIWRNHLKYLKNSKIPAILICATKPGNKFLQKGILGKFYSSSFNLFDTIFTVDDNHSNYFKSLGLIAKIETLTDTRLDRIAEQVDLAKQNPIIPTELFEKDSLIMVAGSSWKKDEEIIIQSLEIINKSKFELRVIFVPHEPTIENLKDLKSKINNFIMLSDLLTEIQMNSDINNLKVLIKDKHIIVDSIGKLLKLYHHADIAYVGCGFGDGVHSVSEPAGYGIPIITGPNITKSPDAVKLKELGSLNIVLFEHELTVFLLELLRNLEYRTEMGAISKNFVTQSVGSSKIISDIILNKINNSNDNSL